MLTVEVTCKDIVLFFCLFLAYIYAIELQLDKQAMM